MKKNKNYIIFGVILLLSTLMGFYTLISKGCVTYFQGITQCGASGGIGLSIILILSVIITSKGFYYKQ